MITATSLAAPLDLAFSAKLLMADLERCEGDFLPYENTVNKGSVYIAPLLSPGGSKTHLSHCPAFEPFAPTAALRSAAYFTHVLDSLPCPKLSARLIKIPPRHGLARHRDNWRGFRFGILRLHVPVKSRRGAVLQIASENFSWRPGKIWYGDFGEEHEVWNGSDDDRVHFVVDVQITPALLRLFPTEFLRNLRRSRITMSPKPVILPPPRLSRFECRFDLPRGLLPIAEGEAARPVAKAKIVRDKNGGLRLRAKGLRDLRLVSINNNTLVPEGIGSGNQFRFGARSAKGSKVEILAKGVLQRHPASGDFMQVDLRHRANAIPL